MLPTANRSAGLARRLALLLVVLSAAGAAGWLWWSCVRLPNIDFLPRLGPAEWIVYSSGPEGALHPRVELSTVFQRVFKLDAAPSRAALRVAGLHRYSLAINGTVIGSPLRPGKNWKQPDLFEVSRQLRPGENQIAVTVFNTNGPPAMWLALDTPELRLNSDEAWQASYAGAAWRAARLASTPKVALAGNQLYGGEDPWAGFKARWPMLLVFAVLSASVCWFIRRLGVTGDRWLVIGLAGLWVALFANNLSVLPTLVGFDANGHMTYIRYIQEYHSLPRADEGWEMFQPPLYYLMGAALLSMLSLSVTQDGGVLALRMMGLVIGVAHFALVWASLRLLFPDERSKPRWGLALAAAVPPLLYLSQYVSNEGLAAALVSACVYLTLRVLKQERASWKLTAGLGLCLGAAMLTKSTALLVVPVVLGALACKVVQGLKSKVQSPRPGDVGQASEVWKGVGRIGVVLGLCAIVCGWHYARLWVQYGSPLIGVWDPRLGCSWWQEDGYRTGTFYMRFGEVLRHPWFSSLKSFGDGIYATQWGDGLFGGAADALARPPWNYDLMAVGYWLALLPAMAVVVGGILVLVKFLRQPSAEWLLLLGLAFLATLAMIHMSIAVPYQCMVKAFYGLCALIPLCAFGAWGIDVLCRWSGKLRPAICVLFGVWAINSYAALWVSRSSLATVFSRTQSLWKEGRGHEANELLQACLAHNPEGIEAQSLRVGLVAETGDLPEAVKLAETVVRQEPNNPRGHMVLAKVLARLQKLEAATEQARRVMDLAPGDGVGYEQLADLLLREGRSDQAIRVAREGLAIAPFSPDLRFALGTALAFGDELDEGISQLRLASAIKPNWAGPQVLLGTTLARQGKLEEAAQHLREALRLEPGNARAHYELAVVLGIHHQVAEAILHYTEALRIEPDFVEALNNLAWIRAVHPRAELRDGPEAVRLAERACKVTESKEPVLVGTLAAAYAEAGRFDEAVATARKARELALAGGQKDLAEKNQKLIERFSAQQPYREPAQP